MDLTMLEIILTSFIPCLAYVILSKENSNYVDIISQTIINTALTAGAALFIWKTTKEDIMGFIAALVFGGLGQKYVSQITKDYIGNKIKK